MPGELGHVHALGTQNCKEVTVPTALSSFLQAPLTPCAVEEDKITRSCCTQKGIRFLSLHCRGTFYTPHKKKKTTSFFLLGPHAYESLFSVTKSWKGFSYSVYLWAAVKKNQKLATRGDQVCMDAHVHQVCQKCTFFSAILPPAVACTQIWKYWGQHSTPQDGTGSKWPAFPHILHCLQPNKREWEPRRKTQQMVAVTICTPHSSQLPVLYETWIQRAQ